VCWSTTDKHISLAVEDVDVGAVARRVGGENCAGVGGHVAGRSE